MKLLLISTILVSTILAETYTEITFDDSRFDCKTGADCMKEGMGSPLTKMCCGTTASGTKNGKLYESKEVCGKSTDSKIRWFDKNQDGRAIKGDPSDGYCMLDSPAIL